MRSSTPLPIHIRQLGFSLIELMISITLGMLVLAAVTLVFVNSSRTRAETEKTSQQIENGRYATQLLLDDIRLAGFYGEMNVDPRDITSFSNPVGLPDPCATDAASLKANVVVPVQGYDGVTFTCALVADLADWKAGTDIVVVRRASTCIAGIAPCAAVDYTQFPYLQINRCSTTLNPYVIDTVAANFTLLNADCLIAASQRAYYTHIYFVTNNYKTGDGIPTLRVAELGNGTFNTVPLVAGIEQLQVEYGIANIPTRTAPIGTPDSWGVPAVYTADPSAYANPCGTSCVPNLRAITTVKLNILARNTLSTMGFSDPRTYILGKKADGSNNSFTYTDNYKRHTYTTIVRLNNVAGRLE